MTAALARPSGFPLSMFDPVHSGMDETGSTVHLDFADHMGILLAGEPGAGKSVALGNIVAHGALSGDCRLILIDGALVELGPWRSCADVFIGPDLDAAISVLEAEQQEINQRCEMLLDTGRRKIAKGDGIPAHLVVVDELAYFSATVGTKAQREKFTIALRDGAARGRKAAVRYVIATQRPSYQIIDTALRDLFGYRWAFRCSTDDSSDTILGKGWASRGYTAAGIDVGSRGVGLLLAEGRRVPRRVKAAYLTDAEVARLAAYAASLRRGSEAA
jgi:S-DNA-T family DNA segregation ATPase FtsK/SpoIIIE